MLKKTLFILSILFSLNAWSQCVLDSTKVGEARNNLIDVEENTAAYYCPTRPVRLLAQVPEDVRLKVKQYIFKNFGNDLYKKIKYKSVDVVEWKLLEDIVSEEPSKGKCSKIKYVFHYEMVIEGWIKYEVTIPVTEKGKVVNKGYHPCTVKQGTTLNFASYCKAFKVLLENIGEDIGKIGEIYIEFNAIEKDFQWVFVQTKQKVLTQKNVNGLPVDAIEYHYATWRVNFQDGKFRSKFIVEEKS